MMILVNVLVVLLFLGTFGSLKNTENNKNWKSVPTNIQGSIAPSSSLIKKTYFELAKESLNKSLTEVSHYLKKNIYSQLSDDSYETLLEYRLVFILVLL